MVRNSPILVSSLSIRYCVATLPKLEFIYHTYILYELPLSENQRKLRINGKYTYVRSLKPYGVLNAHNLRL